MIPDALKERDQWVCWRIETRDGKETKVPVDPHHPAGPGDATDPDTWTDIDTARDVASQNADIEGIGFAFNSEDTIVGVDLDDCRDPDTGKIAPWAGRIVRTLDSATEVSPSGTGVHVYVEGFKPGDRCRTGIEDGEIEMYDRERFFTVTGDLIDGYPQTVETRPDQLAEVYENVFEDDDPDDVVKSEPEPVDLKDAELIEKAKNAKNGDKFTRLWEGDTSDYARVNDDGTRNDGHSEADLALCNMLAYWTGGDRKRIDSLFRQSGLCRDKWTNRQDYRERTIDKALSGRTKFYEPNKSKSKPTPDGGTKTADNTTTASGPDLPEVEIQLSPESVLGYAGYDPEETGLSDLRNSEIAFTLAEMLEQSDDQYYLWVTDNSQIFAYSGGIWDSNYEGELRKALRKALRQRNSKNLFGEVEHAIKSHEQLELSRDDLGAPAGTIAVKNGLLDLRERTVRDLKPSDYAMRKIPTEFDPAADYKDTIWYEFLEDSVRDGDLMKLQEYGGYLLWHHSQPFKRALFLIGPTDSGKGTFLEVLQSVIGEDNVSTQTLYDLMQTRFGTAPLFGKMANIRNEVTPGGLKNVQKFKEMVGGDDRISAEEKGKDPFEFTVTQKFMFSTNQVPEIEDAGEAFFNRLLFAKFPDTVPKTEQDNELADKMKEERSAILNWMLEGLDRLLEQGHFSNEGTVEDKREICDAWGNLVARFKHNVLEVTGDGNDVVHKGQLFDLLAEYADYLDVGDTPKQQTFTKEMKAIQGIDDGQSRKVEDPDSDRAHVFTGVRVKREAIDEIGADMPNYSYSDGEDSRNGEQSRF